MLLKKVFIRYILTFAIILTMSSQLLASGDGDIAVIEGANPISVSQVSKMLDAGGVYLYDTNLEEIRKEVGSIPGSILVDSTNLDAALPADKDAVLVFYCINRLCPASSTIAIKVQEKGYKNVYVMLDGIEGWILSGRPAEKLSVSRWKNPQEADNFTDNIHKQLIFGELPACRDCHGVNGIKVETANTKELINSNCSSCHKKEKSSFEKSGHAEKMDANITGALMFDNSDKKKEENKKTKPLCWDCHSIHKSDVYLNLNHKQVSEVTCGKCHEMQQKLFRDTFHGKALFLSAEDDNPTVTACYDCHGKHNISKVDDVNSTLYISARVETCAKCHPNSNEKFVGFIGHPDPSNKRQNAVLYYVSAFFITLITIVFVLFGIHTILWWTRMLFMRLSSPAAWKQARDAAHHDKVNVRRFSILHRLQHFFMAMSFLTLSLTGLPQMCYSAAWAKNLTNMLGGPIMLTQIHHIAAIVLFIVFVTHIIEVSMVAWKRQDSIRNAKGKLDFKLFLKAFFGPESLFPRIQDFKDLVAHVKWFLFMGPRPQFDRWTYWEKFDYLAEIWGMFTFGITGLILWFPTTFTQILPGWAINLSIIIHSYEALLAIGFIFAVHFFNTHFRVDRFPMDMVIFSGTITKQEMLQERKIWYDRLEKDGKLNQLIEENNNFSSYSIIAKLIGFAMLALGLLFLGLMVYAFIA